MIKPAEIYIVIDNSFYNVFGVALTFEKLFKTDILGRDFNNDRYLRCYKERTNISKSKIDTYSNSKYLADYEHYSTKYGVLSTRYSSALSLSYDLLIGFYNVDTRESLTCRTFLLDLSVKNVLESYLNALKLRKQTNIEARIIGLQTGQEFNYLYDLAELINSRDIKLVEVDLFGTELRHIAFDTRLGTTHNVLLEDRLYRAGELKNYTTMEQFKESRPKAAPR